jgi:hypothetical protein
MLLSVILFRIGGELSDEQKNYFISNHVREFYKNDSDMVVNVCKQNEDCTKYRDVLLSCSTAAQIDRCVTIKGGDLNTYNCGANGRINYLEERFLPTYTQCVYYRIQRDFNN